MDDPELVAALSDPHAYPHAALEIQIVETHISHVFLAGDYAYKVRKPVKFDYVDFSTLALRLQDCKQELRLNRCFSPQLYRDIVPIALSHTGGVSVGGQGTPIEYAVRMRRFPTNAILAEMLVGHRLLPMHIDLLAKRVAALHETAPRADDASAFGSTSRILATLDSTVAALKALLADGSTLHGVTERLRARCESLSSTFRARQSYGHVRECHGDLHLGNVVWLDGETMPFDCLEFDPALRWIDTMNDAAFTFMDLLHHERTDLAWRFLDRYLEASGDYPGLVVLPAYAALRALIRARVVCEHRRQAVNQGFSRVTDFGAAERLIELAAHLLSRNRGDMYLMHGLSGSGKSTVAETMVQCESMIRVRSDVERKRLHRREAHCDEYSAAETARTYSRLLAACRIGTMAGYSMIADATFLSRHWRLRFFAQARRLGVNCWIVHCQAPLQTLRNRLATRAEAGTDPSEANALVLEDQLRNQDPLSVAERACVIRRVSSAPYEDGHPSEPEP
nr:AAA family ATPase [uncultured Cupriavidus sp.]